MATAKDLKGQMPAGVLDAEDCSRLSLPFPILFLDVDGPLNLWGRVGRRILNPLLRAHLVHLQSDDSFNVNVVFSRRMGARLRELGKHFQVRWATSWNQWANQYLSPLLGISEDLPWVYCPSGDPRSKFPAVITSAAGTSFAWVDDYLTEEVAQATRKKLLPSQCALLVSPHIMRGIDTEVLHLLKWFSQIQRGDREPGRREARKAVALVSSGRVDSWLVTPSMVTCLSLRKGAKRLG
ncbi:hypothetical protein [Varibaculum vaginae]|uniref:hypothetical protein n=1 Tax=Varibaculum vaginae TaxID=2364797 RepID=UPI000F0739F7|nr:hypothetical protein [Varibaculum vaginae]